MSNILASMGLAQARPPPQASYHNLGSQDDLLLRHTPLLEMSRSKHLLTPSTQSSTPYTPYTPYQDSAPYTPPLNHAVPQPKLKRVARWMGSGRRRDARIAFLSLLLVLVVNVAATVYMTLHFPLMNGFPVIYRGTCPGAEGMNKILHVGINILSTLALTASSYCMQLLAAPTRAAIDRAHSSGGWLDVGITSLRNLRLLGWSKGLILTLLALSSLPLHLMYNAVVYTAITTRSYNVLYATKDFVTGRAYDKTLYPDSPSQNVSMIQTQAAQWLVQSNAGCIEKYARDFITEYKNVIAVVSDRTDLSAAGNTSLLRIVVNELPPANRIGPAYNAFSWICDDPETVNRTGLFGTSPSDFVPCSSIAPKLQQVASTWWKSGGFQIDHCLIENVDPDCHLHFSPRLMVPVLAMNTVKVLVVLYVAFWLRDKPLVTLDDAIESFIVHPDATTQGMSFISAHEVETTWQRHRAQSYVPQGRRFHTRRLYWFAILSRGQKILLVVIFSAMFASLSVCIVFGIAALSPPTVQHAWSLGTGNVRTQNLILNWFLPRSGVSAILISAVVVNTPQFLLSLLYLMYSRTLTLFHMGQHWDRFGVFSDAGDSKPTLRGKQKDSHRALRVSEPRDGQRKTYQFGLPVRYALPLVLISGLLHWLASQSVFLANISVIPRDDTQPLVDEITTCAYSPAGMLWLIGAGSLMVVYLVIQGFQKFGGVMPIVGSNSIAISAACHVHGHGSSETREHLVTRKLAWGEIMHDKASDENSRSSAGLGFIGDSATYEDRTRLYDAGTDAENEYDGEADERADQIAHCGFSDKAVSRPTEGRLYI